MDPISERLRARHPQRIDLSLERMRVLCAALDDPQHRLPPVIHVAGTNGKGSTVAFIRAIAEAAGLRVHAYTSPHLVRFNERIRLAGRLIDDDALNAILDRVEAAIDASGSQATVFESTTAANASGSAAAPSNGVVKTVAPVPFSASKKPPASLLPSMPTTSANGRGARACRSASASASARAAWGLCPPSSQSSASAARAVSA